MSVVAFYPLAQPLETSAGVGTVTYVAPMRSVGLGSLSVNPVGSGLAGVSVAGRGANGDVLNFNLPTAYVYFHILFSAFPASGSEEICQIVSAGGIVKLSVRINSSGILSVYDSLNNFVGALTVPLVLGKVFRILIISSNGISAFFSLTVYNEYEYKFIDIISGVANQGANNVDQVRLGKFVNWSSQTFHIYYQDIVVASSLVVSRFNIGISLPISDGVDTDWTGDFSDCDEFPHNSDTDFVFSSVSGTAETFNMSPFSSVAQNVPKRIYSVACCTIARKTAATTTNVRVRLRSGPVISETVNRNLPTTYVSSVRYFNLNPNGSVRWTESAYNSIQCGISLQSNQTARMTQVTSWVLYEPFIQSRALLHPI